MLVLTEALNRISRWLEENESFNYARIELLQPGLARQEIEEITAKLPIRLPIEVYELYQWRNGAKEGKEEYVALFQDRVFLSLESAVEKYLKLTAVVKEDVVYAQYWVAQKWNPLWFPITSTYADMPGYHVIIGDAAEQKKASPVVDVNFTYGFDEEEHYIVYSSLTQLMLAEAECYEAGAYLAVDAAYDVEKAESIRRKYQPVPLRIWRSSASL